MRLVISLLKTGVSATRLFENNKLKKLHDDPTSKAKQLKEKSDTGNQMIAIDVRLLLSG
jgi:hypothetical protein